jgi:uncharacterized DUF497 family protein
MYTQMSQFEWDETKRLKNIERRDLDFLTARLIFDGRPVMTAPSRYADEVRFVSTAVLTDGKVYAVVWTWRFESRRIISFRRARDGEERAYRKLFG